MRKREIKVEIPHIAYWWSKGDKRQQARYMKSYMKRVYPRLRPLRIEDKYVICERKDGK